MTTKSLLTFITVISFSFLAYSNSVFDLPTPKKYVNDYANLLTISQEEYLEKKIIEFYNQTSNQIAIVTVKSLDGMDAAYYAHKLAEKWGVGEKNKNNGILILIKPKYTYERGQAYIAVGYGLEGAVPDAIAKRIVDNILIPNFKSHKFYKGINDALVKLFQLTKNEFKYNSQKQHPSIPKKNYLIIAVCLITFLIPFAYLAFLKQRKISNEFSHYYINGEYNSENMIEQIEKIEKIYNHKYPKLKRLILKYEYISKNNLIKYSEVIDRKLFCILLSGKHRVDVFKELADPFLKIIFMYLFILALFISISLLIKFGIFIFLISLFISFVIIYVLANFLISFLGIYLFILRKNKKYIGGISIALFAMNSLFKRNIKRTYDSTTNTYIYYPYVAYSSGSGSGFGGGSFGGSGFGGGSFGGGGAGGSW